MRKRGCPWPCIRPTSASGRTACPIARAPITPFASSRRNSSPSGRASRWGRRCASSTSRFRSRSRPNGSTGRKARTGHHVLMVVGARRACRTKPGSRTAACFGQPACGPAPATPTTCGTICTRSATARPTRPSSSAACWPIACWPAATLPRRPCRPTAARPANRPWPPPSRRNGGGRSWSPAASIPSPCRRPRRPCPSR